MKKILSVSLAAALLGGGLVLVTATSASAATVPDEVCQAVYETVHHEAVGEPTIVNPDYVPATPELPAVTQTEYLYKQIITGKEKWLDSLTWNPGLGWYYAHETREVEVTPAIPAQPAIGEPTIPNPDYVAAWDEQVQTGEHCDVWVTWSTSFLVSNPQNANDVAWPQTFLGFGQIAPECGVQVQQDRYVGSREAIDAILADDTLDGLPPEDSGVVTSWAFADGGTCAPEPQEPSVVVTYGEFGGDEPSCEVPEVTWTRERTTVTTPYIVVGDPHNGWSQVPDTEHVTTVVDVDEVTEVHSYDGDCTPPPTEQPTPPASTPVPVSNTDQLAYTGADDRIGFAAIAGAIVLTMGAGLVIAFRRRKV